MNEAETVDIEEMLRIVGDFNRYQFLLLVLFSVINVLSAFHYFGQIFVGLVPGYKCRTNETSVVDVGACAVDVLRNGSITQIGCSDWTFASDYDYVSLVEDFHWICGLEWIPTLGQSFFFIGSVIGSLSFGFLADKIGRLHCLVLTNLLAFVGNFVTIFTKTPVEFILSRFIAGCATDTNFVMMYIIVMEYIRPKMRTFGLNLIIGVFYTFSCMLLPWLAVLLHRWTAFLIVISVPQLIVLSFYFYLPESAQWLISTGQTDKAIVCFQKIAKYNKRTIPDKSIESLKRYCEKNFENAMGSSESFFGLLQTPKLRRKTLILILKSMAMTLCYDALSRNVNGLGYTPFLVFTITSATILPACLFILAVQDRIGRKALASGALLISGLFTIFSGIILVVTDNFPPIFLLGLAIVARLAINVAYNSGAQYAIELIPVSVRGQGVSVIHVTGYAASFFSPQILYIEKFWTPSPYIILGVLLILSAFACLFLPETLDKVLPVTLEDGERFGEDEGMFEFAFSEKSKTISTTNLVK